MNWKLALTGFFQVFFISINTYFISKEMFLGVAIAAFSISLLWCFNISKISVSSFTDKIIYSLGATLGSLSGLFLGTKILNLL